MGFFAHSDEDNHTTPLSPPSDGGHGSEPIGAAIAAKADIGLKLGGCEQNTASDQVKAHVDAQLADPVTAHVTAHLGDALAAHVDAHLGNEFPIDVSAAIAAHADLGLPLGNCDHIANHDAVTAHVDAHLGDCSHDQIHVDGCVGV